MNSKVLLAALLLAACGQSAAPSADAAQPRGRPGHAEVAIFAGGCFWSAESDIEHVPGVVSAVSGYTGGRVANPSYEQVSGGTTGHLEAVRVSFDPGRISYAALARRFLRTIDPTDPNGQFCDQGPNYRTALFVAGPAQRQAALAAIADANRVLRGRVVTPVLAAGPFYPAESYHQDYAARNPVRYGLYRTGCGRDARLREIWGAQAVTH
jgi:peptide-methionine (S)-S-oxide reductase